MTEDNYEVLYEESFEINPGHGYTVQICVQKDVAELCAYSDQEPTKWVRIIEQDVSWNEPRTQKYLLEAMKKFHEVILRGE